MGRKKPARGRENRAGEAVRACNFCNVKQDFMQNRVRMDTWALPSEILWGAASLTCRAKIKNKKEWILWYKRQSGSSPTSAPTVSSR